MVNAFHHQWDELFVGGNQLSKSSIPQLQLERVPNTSRRLAAETAVEALAGVLADVDGCVLTAWTTS